MNGFYSKFEELQLIMKEYNSINICLQETNFNNKSNSITFPHFDINKKTESLSSNQVGMWQPWFKKILRGDNTPFWYKIHCYLDHTP